MKTNLLPVADAADGSEEVIINQGVGAAQTTKRMSTALLAQAGTRPTPAELSAAVVSTVQQGPGITKTANADGTVTFSITDSLALTGVPTAPTADPTSNGTQVATTGFVNSAVAALVASSPAALDTLNELAAALGNDPNFSTTMLNSLSAKVDSATLAGAAGAAFVGFLAAGAGASARNVRDKLRDSVSALDYGADPTGATDATAAILAAATAVSGAGGGVVKLRGKFLIATNLTLPDNVWLDGGLVMPDEKLPATSAAYQNSGSVLIIDSAATVTTGNSGGVIGLVAIRRGLTLPFPDAATATAGVAAFAGTAFTVGGAGSYFGHLLILGFNQAIYSTSHERVRCEFVQGDCTNGIWIDHCTDIARMRGCHFWEFTTTHQSWTTNALITRTGIAYRFTNVGDWNSVTECFSYGYQNGHIIDSCDHMNLISCGADYPGALASTSVGFTIQGTSRETLLLGCQAAAQGTGMLVNTTAPKGGVVTINGGNLWDCDTYYIRVQQGRALVVGGTRLTGTGTGIQIDPGSLGALVMGNFFDTLTTPIAATGTAYERSTLGPNQFINCVDALGPRRLYDNQTSFANDTAYSSGATGFASRSRFARGNSGAPGIALSGDVPFRQFGQVYDGANFQTIASLRFIADGAPALNATPGKFIIATTPSASVSPTDRWAVGQDGNFGPAADNTYSIGASGARISALWCANGTIQTSDAREKVEVADSVLGLNFIKALRPVSYKWRVGSNEVVRQAFVDAEGNEIPEGEPVPDDASPGRVIVEPKPGVRRHWGLLAQEVRSALVGAGVEDFAGWVLTNPADPDSPQALRYDEFISPLIKAVQELVARVEKLEAVA